MLRLREFGFSVVSVEVRMLRVDAAEIQSSVELRVIAANMCGRKRTPSLKGLGTVLIILAQNWKRLKIHYE